MTRIFNPSSLMFILYGSYMPGLFVPIRTNSTYFYSPCTEELKQFCTFRVQKPPIVIVVRRCAHETRFPRDHSIRQDANMVCWWDLQNSKRIHDQHIVNAKTKILSSEAENKMAKCRKAISTLMKCSTMMDCWVHGRRDAALWQISFIVA